MLDHSREFDMLACLLAVIASGSFARFHCDAYPINFFSSYRLVQIERPKLCPRLMTNAIPNQYAQIWYLRKAREKIKRVTWLDFRVRRWAWRCGRKQVSANQNP